MSIRVTLILACLTTCFAGNVFGAPIYPPDTVYDGPKSVPPLSRPGYRQTVTDPTFGTKITRISGDEMNPSKSLHLQHDYSKDQPWNRDMTLVKLAGARFILNASDYSIYRTFSSTKDENRWSTVDPNILFYVSGAQFRKVNVRTLADTLIHTFPWNILMGPYEGNLSIGDRYVVFNQQGTQNAVSYDIETDTVLAIKDLGSAASDWVSIDSSGNYVVSRGSSQGPATVYDRKLNVLRTLSEFAQHADLGFDQAGNEVMVPVCGTRIGRLDTGTITSVLPSYFQCGHLSTRGYLRPGWAAISVNRGSREIYAFKLDSSNIVQRFAHTRTSNTTYDSEAKGVISPDGSKVMWNSDWGSGTVYAYVAEMSANSGTNDTISPSAPTGLQILP